MSDILKGFRDFILKGNVVDLAVAVVIGTAFAAVVQAIVVGLITPLVAAIIGEPSFDGLTFEIRSAEFLYGSVLNAIITFLSIAAVVYFVVVVPMNRVMERLKPGKPVDEPLRSCPECLSDIPYAARRCSFCTAQVTPETPPATV